MPIDFCWRGRPVVPGGHFRQVLNDARWQQEIYTNNDSNNLPLALERRPDGSPPLKVISDGTVF